MAKAKLPSQLAAKLDNTNDLTNQLRALWFGVSRKKNRLPMPEARVKTAIIREMVNIKRLEMQAARVGLTSFSPISLHPLKTIEGKPIDDN